MRLSTFFGNFEALALVNEKILHGEAENGRKKVSLVLGFVSKS